MEIFIFAIKKKIELITTWHYYFAQDSKINEQQLQLTREDCLNMLLTKECSGKKMKCNSNSCFISNPPKAAYKYGQTLALIGFECKLDKSLIHENNLNDKLFANADSSCLAKDLYCLVNNTTYIWGSEAINFCPFRQISKLNFSILNDIVFSPIDSPAIELLNTSNIIFC